MHLRSRAPAATGTGERGRSVDRFITKLSRKKSSRYKSSLEKLRRIFMKRKTYTTLAAIHLG
jgi:hypothetical protein